MKAISAAAARRNVLRERIAATGISIEDLAHLAGASEVQVKGWLILHLEPRRSVIMRLDIAIDEYIKKYIK